MQARQQPRPTPAIECHNHRRAEARGIFEKDRGLLHRPLDAESFANLMTLRTQGPVPPPPFPLIIGALTQKGVPAFVICSGHVRAPSLLDIQSSFFH